MGRGLQGAVLKGLGAKDHVLTVKAKAAIGPHLVRITFAAPSLFSDRTYIPSAWFRGWFPDPKGSSTQFQRGYTIAAIDTPLQQIAVDFVLHEPSGPASTWARTCAPGDQLPITFYGGEDGFRTLDPPPAGYLLLGCMASYPAIQAITAIIQDTHPDLPVHILMEAHDPLDYAMPLPTGSTITADWVDPLPDGQAFVHAIGGQDYTGWYAWIAGEGRSTRHAKTYLQRECGATRATIQAHAYWVHGKALGIARDQEPSTEPTGEKPSQTSLGEAEQTTPVSILAPVKTALILAGIAQAVVSVIQLLPFILCTHLAYHFLAGASPETMVGVAIQAFIAMGLSALGTVLLVFVMHRVDAHAGAQLRRRLMAKVVRIPLGWFPQRGTSAIKNVVGDDVSAMHYLITHSVLDTVNAIVTPVVALVYLTSVQWRLTLVLLIPVVTFIAVMGRISARDRDKVIQSQRSLSTIAHHTDLVMRTREEGALYGADAIVPLTRGLREMGDFVEEWQRATAPQKIAAVMINRPTTVLGVLLVAGYPMVIAGWIAAADLLPFLILGTAIGGQLLGIATNLGALLSSLQAKAGIESFLSTPELITLNGSSSPPAPPPSAADAERRAIGHDHKTERLNGVHFTQVTFGYRPGQPVLDGFSLHLPPQSFTALVGPSGAGKSTVGQLLARLWDVQGGAITIDGVDIRAMDHDTLYSQVAILLQDVQLIRASVRDNLCLANPDATEAAMIDAAKAAHVHDVIMALPQGYDTVLDHNRLSGGERQRIGIARTLLAKTPVVILDEATASADPDSEWAIQQGLSALLAERTVLMIAHRLATIRGADQIVVMEAGRIAQHGTHDDLINQAGRYRDLWAASAVGTPQEHP